MYRPTQACAPPVCTGMHKHAQSCIILHPAPRYGRTHRRFQPAAPCHVITSTIDARAFILMLMCIGPCTPKPKKSPIHLYLASTSSNNTTQFSTGHYRLFSVAVSIEPAMQEDAQSRLGSDAFSDNNGNSIAPCDFEFTFESSMLMIEPDVRHPPTFECQKLTTRDFAC